MAYHKLLLMRPLGIPTALYTVIFAVAHAAGWVAQWKEMIEDPTLKSVAHASYMLVRHRVSL